MMRCFLYLLLSMAYIIMDSTHPGTSLSFPHKEFQFDNYPGHVLSLPLADSTQMSTKVADKMDCVFSCASSRPWCRSVNFKIQSENDGLHICELLSNDRFTKPGYLKPVPGSTHLSIKNKCLDSSLCQNNGSCIPDYDHDDYHCVCSNVTGGTNCEIFYSDCSDIRSSGLTEDGVYQIDPDRQGSFPVYCDMTTDGGGWTVFQKHHSISFNKGWQDYKTGFGNLNGEFWLGLEKMRRLTKRQVTTLRVDLQDLGGTKQYAVYSSFSIADEIDFYRLIVSGYSGTAGDSMTTASNPFWVNNNRKFSTIDKDNDDYPGGNCASQSGGWWFGWCSISNLNGKKTWWTFNKTLSNTQMKLK